jgi:GGDEF domain-containing protein
VFSRHTFADLGPAKTPKISAGVVSYPHTGVLRAEDLFSFAESALQESKEAPDRVVVAGEVEP